MKHMLLTPAALLAMAALVHAAPKIEAEPGKDYPIHAEAGAWVIVAANYKGQDGPELARQLVFQLRSKHNLPAYVWNLTEKKLAERKAEEERWKQQYPQLPFKKWKIEEECAVMIGGFNDMDSARKYIDEVIRKLPLPHLKLPGGKSAYDTVLIAEPDPSGRGSHQIKRAEVNPLMHAFPSRNPVLGLAGKKADPFLKELNAEEDYSLLKCKEPYTLAVQVYSGGAVYASQPREKSGVSGFLDKLWGGDKNVGEALNAAAMEAHQTAEILRKAKFDAYVLHTRRASIVTIGGFKSADDPNIQRTAAQLAALSPQLLEKLKLFAVPYAVPRP